MTTALCPGSFDPVTNGHINIFERTAKIFDQVIVAVFNNIRKDSFLPIQERLELLRSSTAHIKNITIDSFDGLLADYVTAKNADIVVRGLRDQNDFFYETSQMLMLKRMAPQVESVYLMSEHQYSYVSSSAIRELVNFHGDIKGLVPRCVEKAVKAKFG
ncbi:pantetheine-phosphate adenylyltransferase [Pectinatus cerevisiiphilus]|uniref:Phosphopantetheine adenylyltransferase n=1 Tax=Pectinatus cerevisiiphilus TaxID=86956 RepID=A0A4R3K2L8_9FIRM|nr:pantetheine-phosphate adenylyltransferase [Pectinatus cerevisiiphilus]TCS76690.1 phosphopantetheine adenylyltransferase [Pectinatus cerevisiiphilus]